jgi:hypothetical protein
VADPRLVVGGTCLSSHHPLIARKRFDVCIVDEAGQLTEPVCLGPLANANVFVLVGDHNQLPPLVRSDRARELGMDVSLFGCLSEAHPELVSKLALQFRMNVEVRGSVLFFMCLMFFELYVHLYAFLRPPSTMYPCINVYLFMRLSLHFEHI